MQLNKEHIPTDTFWQNILHEIASNPTPQTSAAYILSLIKNMPAIHAASLVVLDEAYTYIEAGDTENQEQRLDFLVGFANDMAPGIYDLPQRDGKTWSSDPHLLAILEAYGEKVGVLAVRFADRSALHESESALKPLTDSLAILAAQIKVRSRHQLANQLTTSLLQSISDPLFVLDEQYRVLLFNPAAQKIFKIADDAAGKKLDEIVQSETLVELSQQKDTTQQEWTNEDNLTFVPRIEPIHAADNRVEGWILSLRDITRFKKLNHNQNEFTRIVSHDLRSPLTSMQGFANMLELGLVGELNEKQQHFVAKILNGISQMTALVDNIQDAGRYDPETGFYEIERSPCDLREMVNRIAEMQLLPAEKQELQFSVYVADNVPIINADGNMLERAISNLIDNAIKYTPNGGSVTANVKREGDSIQISVQDSGLGISPENQKHLFERHVRIPRQEHRKIKGSGLGLFIVRSVAQRHGGDAWVSSTEGHGSTFHMSIPLSGPNLVNEQE